MKHANKIDMTFSYTPAAATDIRKTIAREKKRLAEQAAKQKAALEAIEIEAQQKVRRIAK